MAIHPIVMHTPDRRWRISADPAGTRFTVELDRRLMGTFSTLSGLETFLAEQGIELADLIPD